MISDFEKPTDCNWASDQTRALAVMEMMGKTFISKDVKAADENDEKQKKLKADKEEDTSDDKNWNR